MLLHNLRWEKYKRQWPKPKKKKNNNENEKEKRNGRSVNIERTPDHCILSLEDRERERERDWMSMFIKYLHQYFISYFASMMWWVTLFVHKIFFSLNIPLMVFDVEH